MADRIVGYEFLRGSLSLSAFAPEVTARAGGVTRKNTFGDSILAVPGHVAPVSDDPLAHLLFALKHEQLNLQIALLALQKIPAEAVALAFVAKPTGWYARQACYLWELANGTTLTGLPAAGGPYGVLFSPDKFLTAASTRSSRWRVDFNGIGSPQYCVTVRRTPALREQPGHPRGRPGARRCHQLRLRFLTPLHGWQRPAVALPVPQGGLPGPAAGKRLGAARVRRHEAQRG